MKKCLGNSDGFFTLFGAIILFLIFGLLTLSFQYSKWSLARLKNELRGYICIKEFNGLSYKYTQQIEQMNQVIEIANKGKVASLLLLNLPAATTAKKVKKVAQAKQYYDHFSFLKNIYLLKQKNCPLSLFQTISPYSKGVAGPLSRNTNGTARGKQKWINLFRLKKKVIKETFQLKKSGLEISTSRIL